VSRIFSKYKFGKFTIAAVLNKTQRHEYEWGNGYHLLPILTLVSDRKESEALFPGRFNPGKRRLDGTQQQVGARWRNDKRMLLLEAHRVVRG
jgi:hypothetical protein